MTEREKEALRVVLIQWFKQNGRALPWRETSDPYKIWVSEVILQQTQVVQGHDYYLRFIDRFPDVAALASAPIEEVLHLWEGLGYYSRAHNMHHATQTIMEKHGGHFPRKKKEVDQLKGIGPYTSAAIMSIAYNEPWAVVDGNVYRVLSRLTASTIPIDTTEGQKHYRALAQDLLSKEEPSLYNQAIMDLGAMVCTPSSPKCQICPLSLYCQSFETELVTLLPLKAKKMKLKSVYMDFLFIQSDEAIIIEQRDRRGIWKGLYQFPLIESEKKHLTKAQLKQELTPFAQYLYSEELPLHRLTHRNLHIRIHHYSTVRDKVPTTFLQGKAWLQLSEHSSYAFPVPLRKYLDALTAPLFRP